MAESVILAIKSWKVSSDVGRRYLLEIGPQFQASTNYTFQEIFLDIGETLDLVCGNVFTFIWADSDIQYSIDDGSTMTGQLVMLTNKDSGPTIKLTGLLNGTKVTITLVS
jgi:hypothetical protein